MNMYQNNHVLKSLKIEGKEMCQIFNYCIFVWSLINKTKDLFLTCYYVTCDVNVNMQLIKCT